MNRILQRALLAVAVASLLTIVASAVAATGVFRKAGSSPIAGVAAIDRPRAASDALDNRTAGWLSSLDATGRSPQIGDHRLGESKRLGMLPDGRVLYVVPTTMNRLCVVSATDDSCGDPLSEASPITLTIVDPDGPGGAGPLAYGAALDGVASVSFSAEEKTRTVPVRRNFFALQGKPTDTTEALSAPIVTFADGQSQPAG
jgi:hypothetical protein